MDGQENRDPPLQFSLTNSDTSWTTAEMDRGIKKEPDTSGGNNPIAGFQDVTNMDFALGRESSTLGSLRVGLPADFANRNARVLAASRPPPVFTGEHPAAWIAQMEIYMEGLGLTEEEKLSVAVTFLDPKATRWYTLALPRSERPTSWANFKVRLMEHYAPYSASEALFRLRNVKQRSNIRDYIDRFNEALADCSNMSEAEMLQIFVEGLHPSIRRFVHMSQPFTLSDAIRMAVYMYADVEASARDPPRSRLANWVNIGGYERGRMSGYGGREPPNFLGPPRVNEPRYRGRTGFGREPMRVQEIPSRGGRRETFYGYEDRPETFRERGNGPEGDRKLFVSKNDRKCYKCGEVGHFAANCAKESVN